MTTGVRQATTVIGYPRWAAVTVTVALDLGVTAAVLGVTAWVLAWYSVPVWPGHAPVAALVGYFAVLLIAVVWLTKRIWDRAAWFDDQGVTIRSVWRTRHYDWQEVSHFTDGHRASPSPLDWDPEGGGPVRWALATVLCDRRVVIVSATSYRGPRASQEMLAEIRQVARQHRVRGRLTGDPHDFRWVP